MVYVCVGGGCGDVVVVVLALVLLVKVGEEVLVVGPLAEARGGALAESAGSGGDSRAGKRNIDRSMNGAKINLV